MLEDDDLGYFDGPIYDPWATFNRTVYLKGSWVLHMLRHVLGDRPEILEVLEIYGAEHAYGTAITSEFQAAAETVYGGGLDWFFQQWVYGMNRPYYEYAWVASDAGDHWNVMLHIDQVQDDAGVFTMPIDIVVQTAEGETTVVVWNDQWSQDFFFTVDSEPTLLEFDPDYWILKHLDQGTGVPTSPAVSTVSLAAVVNPFTDVTRLVYNTPAPGHARLAVYDVAGRHVATLVDGDTSAGLHEVPWNGRDARGRDVASGVYFALLSTDSGDASHKLLRMR
jgi:hypothetical protein